MRTKGTQNDADWARKRYREIHHLRERIFISKTSVSDEHAYYRGRVPEELLDELDARDVCLLLDEGDLYYGGTLNWGRKGEFWASVNLE